MKSVVELLRNELGGNTFFVWLCFFFPHKSTLVDEDRLCLIDMSQNVKPSHGTIETAIADKKGTAI